MVQDSASDRLTSSRTS